ncbi:MAG TPA: rubrerythrin family protein [Firmicutes bacterium]|nr:rubrerythrin family protein [Bacillota bacterium]
MELKGSKTEANLWAAFAGESQARNKYTYFGSQARKEGYQQIGDFFDQTAENEKEHAKLWFQLLGGIAGTSENLRHAGLGEKYEWSEMYKEFEEVAKAEGFDQIARMFHGVAQIEKSHEERFNALRANLEEGKVFRRESSQTWVCRNCGYLYTGEAAPNICPVCSHPQAYFQLKEENY